MVGLGIPSLMTEIQRVHTEEFLALLGRLYGKQYEVEECIPVELTNGTYVWSANSCPPADVLIVALFSRLPQRIEYKIRQQDGLLPVPIIVIGAQYFWQLPIDYSNVCIEMNSGGPYEFKQWVWGMSDTGLLHIDGFLEKNGLPTRKW